MPLFRVELLGQLHRGLDVSEHHRDLLAFTFEGGPRLQDPVGQVFRGVGAGSACGRGRRCRRRLRRTAARRVRPHEHTLFPPGDTLYVDQLFDHVRERIVIEIELPP